MFDRHGNIQDQALRQQLSQHAQIQGMVQENDSIQSEPYAPKYHFYSTTPSRGMNDPNGLCIRNGIMHLFYQQYPTPDGRVHWGHAVSRDMVRWTELPTAITPNQERHAYSGTTLVEDDRVLAIYHGVEQGNMIAQASDEYLLQWDKLSETALIPIVPFDENGLPYRVFDPCIWKEEDGYYALSGTFIGPPKKLRGTHRMMPYLFHSKDLKNWEWLGEFMPHNPFYSQGEDNACPYFFPFGDRYMMLHFSHTSSSHILLGDYDREKHVFIPTEHHHLAKGEVLGKSGGLAAGSATPDGNGGAYAIFNLKTCKIHDEDAYGVMTLPWHMNQENGELRIRPCEGADSLRGSCREEACGRLADRSTRTIENAGNCVEIEAEINMSAARALRITVLDSGDGREHTDITITRRPEDSNHPIGSYHYLKDQTARVYLTVDSTLASLSDDLWPRAAETMDTVIPLDENIRLRIFLDVCTVEVFLNDRLVIAQSVHPTLKNSTHLTVTPVGGVVEVEKLNIWQMEPVMK